PPPPLFPYTTLFRSGPAASPAGGVVSRTGSPRFVAEHVGHRHRPGGRRRDPRRIGDRIHPRGFLDVLPFRIRAIPLRPVSVRHHLHHPRIVVGLEPADDP